MNEYIFIEEETEKGGIDGWGFVEVQVLYWIKIQNTQHSRSKQHKILNPKNRVRDGMFLGALLVFWFIRSKTASE